MEEKNLKNKNERYRNTKNQNRKRRKLSFNQKKVENTGLNKPEPNKIMTTRE